MIADDPRIFHRSWAGHRELAVEQVRYLFSDDVEARVITNTARQFAGGVVFAYPRSTRQYPRGGVVFYLCGHVVDDPATIDRLLFEGSASLESGRD